MNIKQRILQCSHNAYRYQNESFLQNHQSKKSSRAAINEPKFRVATYVGWTVENTFD